MKKKILIFSPPFDGHLNILKKMVEIYKNDYEFKIIITGWKNIHPKLERIEDITTINAKFKLFKTDPAIWTFERVYKLLDSAIDTTKKFKPDLIIYDFFSLEGYLTGKILNIPVWSSIPAMLGPNDNKKYLRNKLNLSINQKYIKKTFDKYKIKINNSDIELISDGFHIAGDVNLVWSFPKITDKHYKKNRKGKFIFIGNPTSKFKSKNINHFGRKKIYLSFGTVVMNNLWNRQNETRIYLQKFIKNLTELWKNKEYEITFVTQGKKILPNYPANWRIVSYADQIEELKNTDLFITHGGSNSCHEAINTKTQMISIPFFGDQPLVGQQIERLGIGINLVEKNHIDTIESKAFLNSKLAKKLDKAVYKCLTDKKYQNKINSLKLKNKNLKQIIKEEL